MDKTRMKFPLSEPQEVFKCSIFSIKQRMATSLDGNAERKVFVVDCANWVQVIPVTASGEIVLVEQHRFGTDSLVLEMPGGAVDPHEKDLTMAAVRELEEETGLTSRRILSLPSFAANPAMQSNNVTFFIAFDVQPMSKPTAHNDPFEVINLHVRPVHEVMEMARTGQIQHPLSALALLLAEPMLKMKFSGVANP